MLSDGEPEDEARVRNTYARYDLEGRIRLWDRSNRGFDRLKREAESRLVSLLEASTIGIETKLLDVGCGEGDLEVLAASRGSRADGPASISVKRASMWHVVDDQM